MLCFQPKLRVPVRVPPIARVLCEMENVGRAMEHNPSATQSSMVLLNFFTPKKKRLKNKIACLINLGQEEIKTRQDRCAGWGWLLANPAYKRACVGSN